MSDHDEKTKADGAESASTAGLGALFPCPFCGGSVTLEQSTERYSREHGQREYWGVVCRNTINLGGTCCMEQVPSASKEAATARWNMRNGQASNAIGQRGAEGASAAPTGCASNGTTEKEE